MRLLCFLGLHRRPGSLARVLYWECSRCHRILPGHALARR